MTAPRNSLHMLDSGQMAAVQPNTHIWLGASAGTGKTQVLSARVLRLLLDGVAPEAILCITYTKAGAAEMAHRIHATLALWVRMADGDLRLDLQAVGADPLRPDMLDRARSLFATVIDSPAGAIRVQTIHSFCQTLLASFPLEASILPGLQALDESDAAKLQRQVLGDLLADKGDDGKALRGIAAMLALRMGQEAALQFLARCAPIFGGALLPRLSPGAADVRAALGLPQGDAATWTIAELDRRAVMDADVAAVAASGRDWGTPTGLKCAGTMDGWLAASLAQRAAMLDQLRGALMTNTGSLRADIAKETAKMHGCYDAAMRIGHAIDRLQTTAAAMTVADDLAAAWTLGSRFAEAYAKAKREAGVADFDDLITLAVHLLGTAGFGDWVRFKLDQRTDHILVDEAQDSNLRQWRIIFALAEEFFAGKGAKDDQPRTLFAVGDAKQAIFGFQGTEPLAFEAARQHLFTSAQAAGNPALNVDLAKNFRSSAAILDVVDAWVDGGGRALMGLEGANVPHIPHASMAGRVELWRPLPVAAALTAEAAEADDIGGEEDDGDEEGAAAADSSVPANDPASLRLSRAIADEVQDWIANGKDGQPVRPGDIMILVRRRRDLAARIVARLQSRHVPVAGVDRFKLTQPLAVQDLLAAMRFAVQPLDDLNLAALLVSPLIGWSQGELLDVATNRRGAALWPHLRARRDARAAGAQETLGALLNMADLTTPYRFLDTILSGSMDGRRRLYARLGREARDPIDELLNQALAFERQNIPSLLGFLAHIDASRTDIKRPVDTRGGVVQVMTVHGSKGLQAPIVILADATDDPVGKRGSFDIDIAGWEKLPVFSVGKGERHGKLAQAYEAKQQAEMEEHWRLLYVAMTRAERLLVVAGITKTKDRTVPEGCWHSAIEAVMADMGKPWQDAGPRWSARRVHDVPGGRKAKAGPKAEPKAKAEPVTIPDWARRRAPEEARPPRPLAPSSLGKDDVAGPPQGSDRAAAILRGLRLHSLFERLPAIAVGDRHMAAMRWLAVQAADQDAASRTAMADEVCAVLDMPGYAALFGPDSLAEVPLSAVVDGIVVAGIVDRLLVTDKVIWVIDYKTGRHVPAQPAEIAPAYLRQMAAYRAALGVIFPGRDVRAALLYTAGPRLFALDDAVLDAHKSGLADAKANLPPAP